MLPNATPLRESAPGPPKINIVLRLTRKMHLCRSSSNVPRLPSFLEMLQNPYGLLTFDNVHNPLRLPRETTSERPKVLRTPQFFALLTSKCASRHNGVHFFDISTSKVVRRWGALYILTSKSASRHNGVQFFISHLASWLRTCALATLLFDPPEPQIIGKTPCFATLLPFRAPGSSFFWDFLFFDLLSSSLLFSSLTLTTSAFHLSILSEVWLLNFLRSKKLFPTDIYFNGGLDIFYP